MLAKCSVNRAAEAGPELLPWWKDWRSQACAIVASGPSAKSANVGQLFGRIKVIAIKECAVELCPWADVVYGCDAHWWTYRRGMPNFKGLKVAYEDSAITQFRDIAKVHIKDKKLDQILVEEPSCLGSGGNSGFQALNLAVQFGATQILLVGFDMHDRSGAHFYGRNFWMGANNPAESNFRRWRSAFDQSKGVLSELGVQVLNASSSSYMNAFRKVSIEQALQEWGL